MAQKREIYWEIRNKVESLLSWADFKQSKEMKKTDEGYMKVLLNVVAFALCFSSKLWFAVLYFIRAKTNQQGVEAEQAEGDEQQLAPPISIPSQGHTSSMMGGWASARNAHMDIDLMGG